MAQVQTLNQTETGLAAVVTAVANALGIDLADEGAIACVRPIFPTAVYDQRQAEEVTGLSASTLFRAVDAGKLICRRAGRRRLYMGSDLLAYLKGGAR
jgi:hypothetical protein